MYVDFKDFNRLSRQSDEVVSLLCQYLFCNGGIIVDALEEFKVVPVAHELSVSQEGELNTSRPNRYRSGFVNP
jgi:hypothetical protein